jgi:hypothetical protein
MQHWERACAGVMCCMLLIVCLLVLTAAVCRYLLDASCRASEWSGALLACPNLFLKEAFLLLLCAGTSLTMHYAMDDANDVLVAYKQVRTGKLPGNFMLLVYTSSHDCAHQPAVSTLQCDRCSHSLPFRPRAHEWLTSIP